MADPTTWLNVLGEILDTVTDVVRETTELGSPERSMQGFQHGDTFVFPGDHPHELINLGCRLLTSWWERDILAQACLAAGGAYFIAQPSSMGRMKPMPPHLQFQVVVGPAVARAHLALRGVSGPRFLLDEETCRVSPMDGHWRRYQGSHRVSRDPAQGIVVTEVAWWQHILNVEEEAQKRREHIDSEIRRFQQEKGSSGSRVGGNQPEGRALQPAAP